MHNTITNSLDSGYTRRIEFIPGAELTELTPEGAHRGKITFKFGPTVAVFRGEAKLTYDHAAKRCVIEARGIDQRGASRARANFNLDARGTDTTDVTLDGGFEVAGKLGQLLPRAA